MARILLIGNSHINAIQRAAREAGADNLILRSHEHMEQRPNGSKVMLPASVALFRREPGPIFSVIGGNAHNTFSMVYPEVPFDFHHPEHPERTPRAGVWMVPYEQVYDSVLRFAGGRLREFRALAAAFPGRVVHLESPPPIPNQRWLTQRLAPRMANAGIAEFEVAAPSLRYKLWRINSAIFRKEAERLGIPFTPILPQTCDAEGFLLRQYWRDPTHANMHYGALVLQQMTELMDVAPV